METKNISNITVKEIFERMLGEENARDVLSKIQAEYDKGTRGEELANFTEQEIQKYTQTIKLPAPIAIVKTLE